MSDLIDKQAAITALTFAKETGTMKCGELKCVIEVLNRLPSAGPKRGKWICTGIMEEAYAMEYRCSVCGSTDFGGEYCSNCGAKMENDEDETD